MIAETKATTNAARQHLIVLVWPARGVLLPSLFSLIPCHLSSLFSLYPFSFSHLPFPISLVHSHFSRFIANLPLTNNIVEMVLIKLAVLVIRDLLSCRRALDHTMTPYKFYICIYSIHIVFIYIYIHTKHPSVCITPPPPSIYLTNTGLGQG